MFIAQGYNTRVQYALRSTPIRIFKVPAKSLYFKASGHQ